MTLDAVFGCVKPSAPNVCPFYNERQFFSVSLARAPDSD
jgi:hypothetical protein